MFSKRMRGCGERRFARTAADTPWDAPRRRDERHEGRDRHDGRHGGPHGGRRGGRLFDHGELRFVLLHLIAEKPRHGYEMIKAIEDRAGGSYSPSPGVVYPTLTLLEEIGYAALAEEGGKKLYAITEAGRAFLSANQRIADNALARMAQAVAARGEEPARPIVRAMENLKLALRLRLSRGGLTDTEVQTIAAALDAAAISVERS